MNDEDQYSFAKKQAVRKLTRQSQSGNKLRKALIEKEISEEVVDQVINDFTAAGYINDEEYAIRLIHREMERFRGPRWIKQKLYAQGISSSLSDKLLTEHYPREIQTEKAKALLGKKKCDPRKQYGLLVRNGFNPDVVYDSNYQ
ncbi:MAG: RecX family transcriptional regulator [Parachlamydiales bacterium]|jgi:SOS response regulatory protein OraA/RecX